MSTSAQKKRLDEKNSKLIRELLSLPSNRHCFECGQRGPTYVNVTEGSFCCTSCSGILRGLNPPQRVKSVSMATFSTDEIEKVRSLGNAENTRIWLGLYGGSPPAMINRDELQSFMVKKYEKKTWYVSPSELAEQERLLSRAKEVASQGGVSERSAGTSSVNSKPSADLDLLSGDPFAPAPQSSLHSAGSVSSVPSLDAVFPHTTPSQLTQNHQVLSPPSWMAPPPPLPGQYTTNATTAGAGPPAHCLPSRSQASEQVLDPFASFVSPQPTVSSFADFDAKFSELSMRSSNTMNAFGNSPVLTGNIIPKSATVAASFGNGLHPQAPQPNVSSANGGLNPFQFGSSSAALQPVLGDNGGQHRQLPSSASASIPVPSANIPNQSSDKYSALAELDELFHTGGGSSAGSVQKDKPVWMPSGFSTGLPPSAYVPAFPDASKPTAYAANGASAVVPGGSSIPKSNTMGAISDFGVNNPFMSQQPLGGGIQSTSQMNVSTNPFASPAPPQGMSSCYPQQQQASQANPQMFQQSAWANPFGAMPAQPPTANPVNVNWNPFL